MQATEKEIGAGCSMQEVLDAYPGARRALFRRYHIGGCSSCGFQPAETLQQVCDRNNRLDSSEVLAHIRTSHEQDAKLQISPAELSEELKTASNLKLVDIRSRPEWNTTKLPGALLLGQDLMQEMLGKWPKDTSVVVYDHSGGQGLDAVAYFAGHGMTNIRCLRGGIDAWSQEVDPSVPRYQVNRNTK
jgi:rhodanese-related sulfurtransferase